jgi:putative Mg2+ transporter-C (MgtC) family protein
MSRCTPAEWRGYSLPIPWFLLGRIAIATLLGGVIGYERDKHGRPAGLRTHMIVALAASTFMAVSTHFVEYQNYPLHSLVNIDVSRIAASIVTGIGFLGGGAILRTGISVQGLTTAAGLWLVGAIGMAAGCGMFVVAVFATAIGLIALGVLRRFEDKEGTLLVRRLQVEFALESDWSVVRTRLDQAGARWEMRSMEVDRTAGTRVAEFDLFLPTEADTAGLIAAIDQVPGLRTARCEPRER